MPAPELKRSSMCELCDAQALDTRDFNSVAEANAFMHSLTLLDISYMARLITPAARLKEPPFTRVTILDVADGALPS